MIACDCAVCRSTDPHNRRLRPSILIERNGFSLVVDTTPDFREQCLRSNVRRLDAILYTHEHNDHLTGLDELRRFCALDDRRLPAYGPKRVIESIERMFPYAVHRPPPYKGLPELDLREITGPFDLGPFRITPHELPHGATKTLGLIFADASGPVFAYYTDCAAVPPSAREGLRGIPLLILDALRHRPHPTHLSIEQALEVVREVRPGRALFTHICHDLDHAATNAALPEGAALAHDGLVVEV
ncbi:MAG: MBL fold metallo-hydrolase [Verrucomicrobiae bacterium]|nr:MBL fold metallo-hydrolase [Verrucomicrobiae bacterium]